jgi:hypothetical protein
MGIRVVWDDADYRILRQVYPAHWTLEDFEHIVQRSNKLLRGLRHTVHIIADGRGSGGAPNILTLARKVNASVPDNQGVVVVVGADPNTRRNIEAARRIAPRATGNLYFAQSLEDAYGIIMTHDPAVQLGTEAAPQG